jgi:hypothetical protein
MHLPSQGSVVARSQHVRCGQVTRRPLTRYNSGSSQEATSFGRDRPRIPTLERLAGTHLLYVAVTSPSARRRASERSRVSNIVSKDERTARSAN